MANIVPLGIKAVAEGTRKFATDLGKMNLGIQKVGKTAGKLTKGIANAGFAVAKFGIAAAGVAAAGVAALGAGLVKLAQDAAPIAGIKESFEDLTESMEGGSKAVLAALKEQSAGMITNTDLMKSFNLASLLIGESFTEQLPDAMKFVGKVALATGEDMGFLMDSLVRGVGRLSPMILDNLGITVNLTEAYEDWAKANGVTVDSMSKAQQQAAVMAQTMSALAEKTADMPEVAGSAQQAFIAFKVEMQDFKDELGLIVLPVVTKLMGTLSELASNVLPKVVDFFKQKVVPILDKVWNVFDAIVDAGFNTIEMWEALGFLIGPKLAKKIKLIVDGFKKFIRIVFDVGQTIKDIFFKSGRKLEDMLPPFILKAWEKFIEVLGKFRDWWDRNGPSILESAKRIFGAIKDTITTLAESIIPFVVEQFNKISAWFDEHEDSITGAIAKIADFFENTLGPAITTLWTTVIQPFFGDFISAALEVAGVLIDLFGGGAEARPTRRTLLRTIPGTDVEEGTLEKSMQNLGEVLRKFLEEDFQQHWINFREFVASFTSLGSWQAIADSWQGIWDNMGLIVEAWIANMKAQLTWENLLSNLLEARIPGFVTPELPPPPDIIDPSHFEGQIPSPFFPGSSGSSSSTETSNFNLTINTSAPVEPILQDFRLMRAFGGRTS